MPSPDARDGANLLALGLHRDAVEVFRRGLEKDPNDLECMLGSCRALLGLQRTDEARAQLLRFLELRPNHPEALSHLALLRWRGGDKTALDELKTLAQRDKAQFPELYNLGLALTVSGDDDGAEAAFQSALHFKPESPYVIAHLGSLAQRRGDLAHAAKSFAKAAELAPKETQPLVLLARVQVAKGDVRGALQTLLKASRRNPEAVDVYGDLIKVNLALGAPKAALASAVELRSRRPGDPEAAYLHGLAAMMSAELEVAIQALELAVEKAPRSVQPRLALAQVYGMSRRVDDALRILEETHAMGPEEIGPALELGLAHLRKGAPDRAKQVLQPALAAHPEEPGLNLNMALALRASDPAGAAACARKAQKSKNKSVKEQAERLLSELAQA